MSPDVLTRALERTMELDASPFPELDVREVSFCGLGDQLLNPHVATYVRAVRDLGLDVAVNTNAARLDAEHGDALLDAGVTRVFVNAGAVGDDYEADYGLPFEKVRKNVAAFAALAHRRCELNVVLVDHATDPERVHEVERFWRTQGVVRFFGLDLLNRGGSLVLDGMDFERATQHPEALARLRSTGADHGCMGPFAFPFIGYDGRYYLCSSDWTKEAPVGDVHEQSLLEVMLDKAAMVRTREPVCRGCNHDAVNRLTAEMARRDAGEPSDVDGLAITLDLEWVGVEALAERVQDHLGVDPREVQPPARGRLIPVSVNENGSPQGCGAG